MVSTIRITDNIYFKWNGFGSDWTLGLSACQQMVAHMSMEEYEEQNFEEANFVLTNKITIGFWLFSIILYYS